MLTYNDFVFQNPVATAFEIFWMIFEPILFGITGTQIKINELDPHAVSIGISCLLAGIIVSTWHCTNRVGQYSTFL
jgi:uncharacterized membrane protein